jgi:hypothetical protein
MLIVTADGFLARARLSGSMRKYNPRIKYRGIVEEARSALFNVVRNISETLNLL